MIKSPFCARRCTVDPNPALSCGMRSMFMSEISPMRFLSIAICALTMPWRSFAALYSAFSRRSPYSRAFWISFGSSTFSSRSSTAISSFSRLRIRSFTVNLTLTQSDQPLRIGDSRWVIAEPPATITNQEIGNQQSQIANRKSQMKTVSSRQNPIVRAYRDLADEPDPGGARLLLDGAHLVREARAACLRFESVAAAVSHLAGATEEGTLAHELERDGVDVVAVDDQVFSAMSPVHTPSGIVAIAHRHPTTAAAIFEQASLFALVVSDVQDPGNLGSLLRVAEAGGATGVIVCGESA